VGCMKKNKFTSVASSNELAMVAILP